MSSSIPTETESPNARTPRRRGKLKVFLGYAAGVGKTFRMLDEAQQLKHQGINVVVGYFEPHGRRKTIAKAEGLELIPRCKVSYRGSTFEEMDTSAILERHPAICVVDELAHTNVPGSEHTKRWEDVQLLLDAGIDVFTTVNIQHLESLNDQVFEISGIRVRETLPDWVVKQADEVVMVDATTGALLNRLKRGDIYDPAKAQAAMENFFKESTLAALRELALRETARELELREEEFATSNHGGLEPQSRQRETSAGARMSNKILVHVTADPSTAMVIRRGRRVADFWGSECFAVFVSPRPDLASLPKEQREAIEKHLNFARNLHIETRILEGDDPAETLVDFARRNEVAQILLARPRYNWTSRLLGNFALKVIQKAMDMRVVVVADRR
jgi:two-component system sensor histidine kinase KdpD